MKAMLTLIKKECLENRGSVFWLPLAIATVLVVVVVGSLLWQTNASIVLNDQGGLATLSAMDADTKRQVAAAFWAALSLPFFAPLILVVLFYLAHALFDERKDRSILFWKSLPISDRASVVSKLLIAIVVMPLVYWLASLVTQGIVFLALSTFGAIQDIPVWSILWAPDLMGAHAATSLLALLVHGLWVLPIYAWLLFCSSWAPRSPLMVAIAIAAIVSLSIGAWRALNTGLWTGFQPLGWMANRFGNGPLPSNFQVNLETSSPFTHQSLHFVEILQYLVTPSMWLGWVVALLLLMGAIYMRHRATA